MGRIDAKLGKWFKQVEQVEKELQQKKKISATQSSNAKLSPVDNMVIEKKPSIASESADLAAGSEAIIVKADYIEAKYTNVNSSEIEDKSYANTATKVLKEDVSAPEIEDFMSYLDKVSSFDNESKKSVSEINYTEEVKPSSSIDKYMAQRDEQLKLQAAALKAKFEETKIVKEKNIEDNSAEPSEIVESKDEISYNSGIDQISENDLEDSNEMGVGEVTVLDNLSEGTGSPRPISKPSETNIKKPNQNINASTVQKIESIEKKDDEWTGTPKVIKKPEPRAETVKFREEPAAVEPKQKAVSSENGWDNVPSHLKILFADTQQEVAQNSYKKFRESRSELIERLLDPSVSLEEAARILNVCPTTVRRYTNKGVLKHYRTAGNQRRFKLSDVLAFMELQGKLDKAKTK
ncbi:MAG: helix-turn-helix domain-containing protein [Armatimonadota bacterium]